MAVYFKENKSLERSAKCIDRYTRLTDRTKRVANTYAGNLTRVCPISSSDTLESSLIRKICPSPFPRKQRMSTNDWPIIGIDLGTTYSCVAIWKSENQRAEIIVNESGYWITPSMVAFTEHDRLVGVPAKNQATRNPRNTVYDSKRLIGKKYSDAFVKDDMKHWPFKVVLGSEDRPLFDVMFKSERKQFSAEEISAALLSHMKKIAEIYLRREVKNAVVTVPAYFNDSQRCATMDAARIAGLNVLRIINEPTAVALAYGLEKINSGDVRKKNVLIFDLGGGTFDVTLLEIERGIIEVKAKSGNNHLGGQDFDKRLMAHFAEEFKRKYKLDIYHSERALLRLKTKCEQAKRMLSTTTDQVVSIECLYKGMDLYSKISRAKFDDLNMDLFEECIDIVGSCLRDANIDKSLIDDVVLVGGSSRIPKVQELLMEFLNVNSFCQSINPDEAVAYGAAVQAAILGGVRGRLVENMVLQDSTPLSLGVRTYGEVMTVVVPRNTTIPVTANSTLLTASDNQEIVCFDIYEGENKMTAANNRLGIFRIYDLPRKPQGEVSFTVTFDIDANSVLTVTAVVNETGKTERTTIQYDRGRLTREEIDRMVLEAEMYKQADEVRRQEALAKHELEQYAYYVKKQIENRHISSQLDAAAKKQIQQEVREAIEWSENTEHRAGPGEYRRKKSSLETSWGVIKVAFGDLMN